MVTTYRCSTEGILASRRFACGVGGLLGGTVALAWGEIATSPASMGAGALLLLAGGVSLWLAIATRYVISPFDLVVRFGPLKRRIPLECIEGAIPARRRVVGPRGEIEVLSVAYRLAGRPRMAHLVPEERDRFLRELAAKAPFLELRGESLVRVPTLG
ncbi:MAG TPA: hypothetical protein VF139_03720 [Candidatus Polarisedimenticolaceae bacterium]